jgi:spermidine synthase
VGILGLGAGVLAAYNGPGDLFHFYEINPLIVRFARDYFTYLEQAPGEIEVTTDDARLALEREPAQGYDLLVADAFSGDAIPLHLMTREAFEQYERHLKPEGILAVNISNRYLDLSPVVARLASGLGRTCVIVEGDREPDAHLEASTWAILLNDRERIEYLLQVPSAHIVTETEGDLWTDDYVNLLSVIR